MPGQYITCEEVAEMLDVSKANVYHWIKTGLLRGYKLIAQDLKHLRFVRTSIEDLTLAMRPTNKTEIKSEFIERCQRNYDWYFARHPERKIPKEQLRKYLEDFAEEFFPEPSERKTA